MDTQTTYLYDELYYRLDNRDYRGLRELFEQLPHVETARFLETLDAEQATLAFRTLPKEDEMAVFAELDAETQQLVLASITDQEIARIMEDLAVDDAVDMLEEMPAKLVRKVLRNSSPETRDLINEFLRYPENSTGSIMTAEFVDLQAGMTVEDAIKRIRRSGADRETIYTCYVMDENRFLQGIVTVKKLLFAPDDAYIGELMERDVISVTTQTDQEIAAKLMAKYDFMALPVVDAEGRLVGIVTVDDALDVLVEEDTEDFEKMSAISPSEKPYLKTKVSTLAKNRFFWLLLLMLSNLLSGMVLGHYQYVFILYPLLVTLIPMLTGTGGNAGSQASTMVIRGMALGDIQLKDWPAVAWKEARVSLLVGVILAACNYVRIILLYPGYYNEALVAALSMLGVIVAAKVLGGLLPMGAKALKIDPTLMAAPAITTLVDVLALLLYFGLAKMFLPMPG